MGRKTEKHDLGDDIELSVTQHPVDEQFDLMDLLDKHGRRPPNYEVARAVLKYSFVNAPGDGAKRRKFELGNKDQFKAAFDGRFQAAVKAVAIAIKVNFEDPPKGEAAAEQPAGEAESSSST